MSYSLHIPKPVHRIIHITVFTTLITMKSMQYLKFTLLLFASISLWSCSGDEPEVKKDTEIPKDDVVKASLILLDFNSIKLEKGNVQQIGYTVYPKSATVPELNWTSLNTNIATVSKSGRVKAINAGKTTIRVMSTDGELGAECSIEVTISIKEIKLKDEQIGLMKNKTYSIEYEYFPKDATKISLDFSSSNSNVASVDKNGNVRANSIGEAIIRVSNALNQNVSDSCIIKVNPTPEIINGYECVDLDLPSGTLWAKMNLGAKSISDMGTYYYWGETANNTSGESIFFTPGSTYTDEDGFTHTIPGSYINIGENIQHTKYDAAHVNMGNNWMLPSTDDFDELIKNTTREEVIINDVKGIKFTGKNGNYMFIPAVGAARSDGSIESYSQLICLTNAYNTSWQKYAGTWYYTLPSASGTIVMCIERSFRHQVRGIIKVYE